MTFRLTIETDNAAFEGDAIGPEIARLLRAAADILEEGIGKGRLRDINGNWVCEFDGGYHDDEEATG